MRLKINSHNYFFHPFEIAFSGYSNSGKTTLIEKLIGSLSSEYLIGYLKHDAHFFEMDKKGKDTERMQSAGAQSIMINDKSHFASVNRGEIQQRHVQQSFIESDMLLIEGHKFSKIPKILFLGQDENKQQTINEINSGEITNISALIYTDRNDIQNHHFKDIPSFHRDDISGIKTFILSYFSQLFPSKLYGLVLTGGQSTRMNKDKGSINYHKKPQAQFVADMLEKYTDKVYISCRQEQTENQLIQDHQKIYDTYPSVGPTTGIISAMHQHPKVAWLVVACDLPYLDESTLDQLVEQRNPFKVATCYLNPLRQWAEPLCTIYEPKSYQLLMSYFANNRPCPRKLLMNTNIQKLELKNKRALNNVNTPEEFQEAVDFIKKERGQNES